MLEEKTRKDDAQKCSTLHEHAVLIEETDFTEARYPFQVLAKRSMLTNSNLAA